MHRTAVSGPRRGIAVASACQAYRRASIDSQYLAPPLENNRGLTGCMLCLFLGGENTTMLGEFCGRPTALQLRNRGIQWGSHLGVELPWVLGRLSFSPIPTPRPKRTEVRHRNDMGLELGIPTWDDSRLVAAWLHTTWVHWFNGFLSCSFSYHLSIILPEDAAG